MSQHDEELNAIHSTNPNQVRDVVARRATRGEADLGTVVLGLLYVGDRIGELINTLWETRTPR